MKKYFIVIILFLISFQLFAQVEEVKPSEKRTSLTVDILQGGGSLIGADFEALLSDRVGAQIGFGFTGFGAALNYHLKPSIRSSFFSLMYWHQGIGDGYSQSVLGPNYVYRGKKWFTAQIGLGYVLGYGPSWPVSATKSPVIFTYAIGAYFPL